MNNEKIRNFSLNQLNQSIDKFIYKNNCSKKDNDLEY